MGIKHFFYYVFWLTLCNPKIMLFYLALLPTIVDLTHVGVLAWTELVGTMLAILILTDCLWSLLASRARAFLTSARAKRTRTALARRRWRGRRWRSQRVESAWGGDRRRPFHTQFPHAISAKNGASWRHFFK